MSVCAFITEGIDTGFYTIPVASEKWFYKYWQPAIEELDLYWFSGVYYGGFDINKDQLPEVIDELKQLRVWFENSELIKQDDMTSAVFERVDDLIARLPLGFEMGEDNIIFIG